MHDNYDTLVAETAEAKWLAAWKDWRKQRKVKWKGKRKMGQDLDIGVKLDSDSLDPIADSDDTKLPNVPIWFKSKTADKIFRMMSTAKKKMCINALPVFMGWILKGILDWTGLHGTVTFASPIPKYNGKLWTVSALFAFDPDVEIAIKEGLSDHDSNNSDSDSDTDSNTDSGDEAPVKNKRKQPDSILAAEPASTSQKLSVKKRNLTTAPAAPADIPASSSVSSAPVPSPGMARSRVSALVPLSQLTPPTPLPGMAGLRVSAPVPPS
ncbi:unnamed protein product [Mycena citricolor]|uniref:Uncharacterized protein n=1 Tax=Mycena citricolor TaxID=2018698 RepID=A0AAD2HWP2_9AGAR|nr:unnamed protein product [Mycena citricolor]